MKKTLLLATSLFLIQGIFAQYTITASRAPLAGDLNYEVIDTLPTVTAGPAGQNKTWDLSAMNLHVDNTSAWGNASTAPNAADFPDAELTMDNGGGLLYFDLTASRLEWIGLTVDVGNGPAPVRLSNPESALRFPSAFQTTFRDTGAFKYSFYIGQDVNGLTIDSARINYKSTSQVLFDGTGTLLTPANGFSDVLRSRTYSIVEQKFEACVKFSPLLPCGWVDAGQVDPNFSSAPDTSVTYTWYNSSSTSPLATVTYDAKEANVTGASFNNDPLFTGVNEIVKNTGSVYPNPANDFVFIRNIENVSEVKITDLQGRIVLTESNIINNKVNITDLSAGNYVITIVAQKGVYTDQLSIIK